MSKVTPPPIRLALAEESPRIVEMLVRAFADDPFLAWLVRDDGEAARARGYQAYFELSLEMTRARGDIYVTDDLSGAALFVPPGRWQMGLLEQAPYLPKFFEACSLRRFPSRIVAIERVAAKHPKERHAYLFVLGVDPVRQGKGLGRALVTPALERCDREGVPVYLETAKEKNLGFYRSLGFEHHAEVEGTFGAPKIWLMWRKPR